MRDVVTGRELLDAHMHSFNAGVRTGDWEPMLARFAPDAELVFENVPAGPYRGIGEIRAAYEAQPPDDEMRVYDVDESDRSTIGARFAWNHGGTGRLVLEHDAGTIRRLAVIFDQ
jgi:hypothetical protein